MAIITAMGLVNNLALGTFYDRAIKDACNLQLFDPILAILPFLVPHQ